MGSLERRGFADQLSIETPEQVALEFPLAGLGSRFLALLLDHLIQFAAMIGLGLLLLMVLAAGGPHLQDHLTGKWFFAGVTVVFFLLLWGYFALFEAFWHGQTPGKRALKLRVIKDAGRQITLFEALARNLLRFVDYLPGMYLTGVIAMLCNRRNKRLGDLAAGTLVVHERTEAQPLLWTGTVSAFAPMLNTSGIPADAVARLGERDLVLVESFFARALDLPLDTRVAMAASILREVCGRMVVPVPEGNPERLLEGLLVDLRGQGRR